MSFKFINPESLGAPRGYSNGVLSSVSDAQARTHSLSYTQVADERGRTWPKLTGVTVQGPGSPDRVTYNWSFDYGTHPTADATKPLTLLRHLGGSPILAFAGRSRLNAEQWAFGAKAAKREALAREMEADRQPQTNLPIVPLTAVRGGAPVRTLKLPAKPGWVALWVEPGDTDYPAYRATLRKTEGTTVVFEASRLALNDLGALLITVHSTSLTPGAYRLEVEGLPGSGAPVVVGQFSLRVE